MALKSLPGSYVAVVVVVTLAIVASIASGVAFWQLRFFPSGFWRIPVSLVSFCLSVCIIALIPVVMMVGFLVMKEGAGASASVAAREYGPGLSRQGPIVVLAVGALMVVYLGGCILLTILPSLLPSVTIWRTYPSRTLWTSQPIKDQNVEEVPLWQTLTSRYERSDAAEKKNICDFVRLVFYCGGPLARPHARRFILGELPNTEEISNEMRGEMLFSGTESELFGARLLHGILLPIAAMFLVSGVVFGANELYLRQCGVVTSATVTAVRDGKAKYTFKIGDTTFSGASAEELNLRGIVDVRYIPSNPQFNGPVVKGWGSFILPILFTLVGEALELSTLSYLVWRYRNFSRDQYQLPPSESGARCRARV